MEKVDLYRKIDDLEQAILRCVNITKSDYRKSNLRQLNLHYLEFNWRKREGPTVILLHGYGASGIAFYRIIPGEDL